MKRRLFLRWIFPVLLLLLGGGAFAQGPAVTATISSRNGSVGEPLQFELRCSGTMRMEQPPPVRVDGLDIRYVGPSTQMQIINGAISSSITHVYQIVPMRAGTFTIPAIEVELDGRRLRTTPVSITATVGASGGAAGGVAMDKVGFAEITLSKKTAYVGEALVAEVRLYVDAAVQSQIESMPQLQGEGFTKTKLGEPRRETDRRNDREYNVLVFRTAITPSKAGRIAIGPAEFNFIANIPRAQRARQRSLFDMFDDVIGGGVAAQRRVSATAAAVEIEVKPLPVQGRPESFAGAVGSFQFAAEGSPRKVKVGDPVTMRLRVSGRGNFDRVAAPAISDTDGWRSYPPSGSFAQDDELGMSGTKTFEVAVIPETAKTALPEFQFSFFDPDAEKYVTLASAATPLEVTGAPPPPPPPAVPAARNAGPENAPTPPPASDILGLRYDAGTVRDAFTPLYARRSFVLAQLVPLALVLALLARRFLQRSDEDRERAVLRREKETLLRKLRTESAHAAFFDAAARVIQLETAGAGGPVAGSIDARDACASRSLDPGTAEAVAEIFQARSELLYAGHGDGGREPVTSAERERVLVTINRFSSANAKS